ncbi:hypothetical protein FKM82_028786 [Ascaphus truei]
MTLSPHLPFGSPHSHPLRCCSLSHCCGIHIFCSRVCVSSLSLSAICCLGVLVTARSAAPLSEWLHAASEVSLHCMASPDLCHFVPYHLTQTCSERGLARVFVCEGQGKEPRAPEPCC